VVLSMIKKKINRTKRKTKNTANQCRALRAFPGTSGIAGKHHSSVSKHRFSSLVLDRQGRRAFPPSPHFSPIPWSSLEKPGRCRGAECPGCSPGTGYASVPPPSSSQPRLKPLPPLPPAAFPSAAQAEQRMLPSAGGPLPPLCPSPRESFIPPRIHL